MDFDLLFPGRFAKGAELKGREATLTISKVVLDKELKDDKRPGGAPVISFKERPKQWVLNKTNAHCLKAMFGRDTEQWIGKRVTLHAPSMPDPFNPGETITPIRVKGSPDIDRPVVAEFTLGRQRRQTRVTLVPTGQRAAQPTPNQVQRPAPPPQPAPAPSDGWVDTETYQDEPPPEAFGDEASS